METTHRVRIGRRQITIRVVEEAGRFIGRYEHRGGCIFGAHFSDRAKAAEDAVQAVIRDGVLVP